MARLRREWGYQHRAAYRAEADWQEPRWSTSREMAERIVANGAALGETRRLVSRIIGDVEVVPDA